MFLKVDFLTCLLLRFFTVKILVFFNFFLGETMFIISKRCDLIKIITTFYKISVGAKYIFKTSGEKVSVFSLNKVGW